MYFPDKLSNRGRYIRSGFRNGEYEEKYFYNEYRAKFTKRKTAIYYGSFRKKGEIKNRRNYIDIYNGKNSNIFIDQSEIEEYDCHYFTTNTINEKKIKKRPKKLSSATTQSNSSNPENSSFNNNNGKEKEKENKQEEKEENTPKKKILFNKFNENNTVISASESSESTQINSSFNNDPYISPEIKNDFKNNNSISIPMVNKFNLFIPFSNGCENQYNKFSEVNRDIDYFTYTYSLMENTEILSVNIRINPNKTVIFKLRRFDDLFYTVKCFCEINHIDSKLIRPLIIKILCTLNNIYQICNSKLEQKNINSLQIIKDLYNDN